MEKTFRINFTISTDYDDNEMFKEDIKKTLTEKVTMEMGQNINDIRNIVVTEIK